MTIFNFLNMIGGLCLFLFGMNLMGQALERSAGNKLRGILGKLTSNKAVGLLTGLFVTAIIQSSSATTVMVVGFVNSGLMTLKQSIHVIMGANIGTTVTAWILSLSGISSDNVLVQLLKPTSFTPILAVIGTALYMFSKSDKKKDIGMIFLGFATLMFGMETMSSSVAGLKDIPEFQHILLMFESPVLGVLAGTLLTAIIQSSSASVGILQALASTGSVTYGSAIPIIMGQNIGTCVTALLSSVGTTKNAKRAAMVHLAFNVIGSVFWLIVYSLIKTLLNPVILSQSVSMLDIAIIHSIFNILCTLLMLPLANMLERIVYILIPETKQHETETELDDRLLSTPSLALEQSRQLMHQMAGCAIDSLKEGLLLVQNYREDQLLDIRTKENKTDHYEDILGTYLVKLSAKKINEQDSAEAAEYLKLIGDFERIADHSVNIGCCAEEINKKSLSFSKQAQAEFGVLTGAVTEVLNLTYQAFVEQNLDAAQKVEPLGQLIDELKEKIRTRHIFRLQQGDCSIEMGFILSDLLTNLIRVSDHCSNVAGCVTDMVHHNMNLHESLREYRNDNETYQELLVNYRMHYSLPE